MSLPTYTFTCSGCSLQSLFVPYGIAYRYKLPDGSDIEAKIANGWCTACDAAGKMQPHLTPDSLQEKFVKLKNQFAAQPKPGFFNSLFGKRLSDEEYWSLYSVNKELERIPKLQELVGNRAVPARCLTCGSHSVEKFSLTEYGSEGPVPLPFAHPNCGGTLLIEEAGRWMSGPQPPVFLELHDSKRVERT